MKTNANDFLKNIPL